MVILKPLLNSDLLALLSEIKNFGNSNSFFSHGLPASLLTAQPELGETYERSVILILKMHIESSNQKPIFLKRAPILHYFFLQQFFQVARLQNLSTKWKVQ